MYNKMISRNAPLKIADLKISGDDIIEEIPNIQPVKIGKLLEKILYKCAAHPTLNEKAYLIKIAKQIVKKDKKGYLEV